MWDLSCWLFTKRSIVTHERILSSNMEYIVEGLNIYTEE